MTTRDGQYVQLEVGFYLPRDVTTEEVVSIVWDALVQIEEPVKSRDDSGNDIETDSWGIGYSVKIDGRQVASR